MKDDFTTVEMIVERVRKATERHGELEWLINAPEIVADNRYWRRLVAEYETLTPLIGAGAALKEAVESGAENDISEKAEAIKKLLTVTENLSEETAFLEIKVGNADAKKFAEALFLAYGNFCGRNGLNFKEKVSDCRGGNLPPAKYAAEISGAGAWSLLKEENGIHQAAQVKIFVLIYEQKSVHSSVDENDVKIDVFHSGGAGGQNVNKVESAARATHLPTGIACVCQDERSQLENRKRAVSNLLKKVEQHYKKQSDGAQAAAKKESQKIVDRGTVVRTYDFQKGVCKNAAARLTAEIDRDGKIKDLF